MSIHRKIASKVASFLVLEASWIAWLMEGFSLGGTALALERAVTLIRASAMMRKLRVRLGRSPGRAAPRLHDSSSALLLSSSF